MHNLGLKILKARFGIYSNVSEVYPDFLFKPVFESLLTDYHKLEKIDPNEKVDVKIFVEDNKNDLKINIGNKKIQFRGNIVELTKNCEDMRFTIFGNEGFIFRYTMRILEEFYNIYSFHACSLYDEGKEHLYIACGGAGSGKSCLILKGLELGLKIFSTEITHFEVKGGDVVFYKGSLIDNVRIGNLVRYREKVLSKLNIKIPESKDIWGKKIPVDLVPFETSKDILIPKKATFIFPHIEEERRESHRTKPSKRQVIKRLFDNASQKIGESVLYYEKIAIPGFDIEERSKKRFLAMEEIVEKINLGMAVNVVAGTDNCWEGIL